MLLNLGSPASPAIPDVRRYLDEFLMDPRIIDSPWLVRRLIVSGFILPFRPKRTSAAYNKIWLDEAIGSPLLKHSQALADAVAAKNRDPVVLAMRYGQPSVAHALAALPKDTNELILVPLYPQHADSTTTTSIEAVQAKLAAAGRVMEVKPVPAFYADAGYLDAQAAVIQDHLPADVDKLLFSYHGLPERHLTRTDPTGSHCLQREDCCERASAAHATCYRYQVYQTSTTLAGRLNLSANDYQVSFQSRLGRLPWLTPYTDVVLRELPEQGVKRLAVACPAFVADNLETLEEIGMQGRDTFINAGGESFTLIPCMNDDPRWVDAFVSMLDSHVP